MKPRNNKKLRRFLRLKLFFLFLFLIFISGIRALDRERSIDQFHHTAWTAKDGAPSQISALAQTADGYLWIGSALGLFRFDGVQFEQYEPPGGVELPSNNIYALMATPDGGLWISFRPSGIGYLKDGQLKIFQRPEELPRSQVYCFARTFDGKIWAGTHDGLALFNGASWDEIGIERQFQPNRIRTMMTDRSGTLWISKDDAIVFLRAGANNFQEFAKQDKYALQFAQAKDERIWAARFLKQIEPIDGRIEAGENSPEIEVQSSALLFDRDGSLWLAAFPEGVKHIRFPERLKSERIDASDAQVENFRASDGLSGNLATNILEDREGNIWVGTDKGLDRFRYSSIIPFSLPKDSQRLTLTPAENGSFWTGNNYEDSLFHLANGRVEMINLPKYDFHISSFYKDERGEIWWGGHGGIMLQKGDEFQFYPKPTDLPGDFLWEVFRADPDGGLWVNYGDLGLHYFKNGVWEKRSSPAGLPDRGPSASFQDDRNRIWLGYTENRVFILDGTRVVSYGYADGIEIGRIKVIRGCGGNFWFGGESGLAFFKDERFYTVKTDGKQFGAVSGIITTENGDLWLNEAHGVIHIDSDEIRKLNLDPQYAVKYRLYDFQDNLPGGPQMNFTVSTAIETTDHRLWFATDNGLAMIDPARLEKNALPPPVIIKNVIADDGIFDPRQKTILPSGTTNLQINYAATSLSIPERVVYKYRLEGLEDQWRDAGVRREAFYNNLPPGKYRFQVIAANNDGVWNEEGASFEIEVLPMFYQTKLFALLCFAGFVLLVWTSYQWRVHHVKSRLHLLYEERLSERTRIAQELHDTLLQGMVSVSMQLESAYNKVPADSPAKARLERMRGIMQQIIKEGRHTVNGLRSSGSLNGRDLEHEISQISQQLNADGSVNFRISVEGVKRSLRPTVHEEIFQICREALANSFRHSDASRVEAELQYAKNNFRLIVRDDGVGIDQQILETGRKGHWGLYGMKERAEKIGAALKLYSRTGAGTEIELTVPNRFAFRNEKSIFDGNWLGKLIARKNKEEASERLGQNEN